MSQYRGIDVAVYTYTNFAENNLYSGIGLEIIPYGLLKLT